MKRQTSGCIRQVSREEEPAVPRNRVGAAEQVLEHRGLRARRVDPLRDLGELLRVAEQHDVPRRRPDRERVGERDLARLVDEERVDGAVHVLAREEPGGAGEEQHVGDRAPRSRPGRPSSSMNVPSS